MESHMERGGETPLNSAAIPCITRHKCHSCERTRSVKVRLLSWFLGKFSLLLIIVVTSAMTTFLYHKLLPDDVRHGGASSSSSSSASSSTSASLGSEERHEARHTDLMVNGQDVLPGPVISGRAHQPTATSSRTAARLGLQPSKSGPHLSMTSEGSKFFTSGHVKVEGGALVVQRATTLFLSADVILNSMGSQGKAGPSTVVVCLSLAKGHDSPQNPITCHLTYLRKRDQQMARVWMLFQAEAKDRIYVNTSWPSYVISDNRDNQQSVFQAFEV